MSDLSDYPVNPVLMVDDEKHLLQAYDLTLNYAGITNTIVCSDSRDTMGILKENDIEVMLLDLSMPHIQGEELLQQIVPEYPNLPVIIITGNDDIESAVECMKTGAFDYLLKPVEESRLVSSVKRALELRELKRENSMLKEGIVNKELRQPEAFSEIITVNDELKSLFRYMEAIAKTKEPVLITGETGVGKELIARAMHKVSDRKGAFVTSNVAGLDDQMFADTLFGHVKGAFTGAERSRAGLIEKAQGGTLFLDEIGDLEMTSQVKLLRLLQESEYYPLGDDEPRYTDALIVLATNQDLRRLMQEGKFRKDLFYRLNVHQIVIPPLRSRKDDIPALIDHFLEKAAEKLSKKKPTAPPELTSLLKMYHFPGNVRELESLVYDAVSRHTSKVLSLSSFKEAIKAELGDTGEEHTETAEAPASALVFPEKLPSLKEIQNLLVDEAMRRADNNQSIAASMLGISRQALNKRLK